MRGDVDGRDGALPGRGGRRGGTGHGWCSARRGVVGIVVIGCVNIVDGCWWILDVNIDVDVGVDVGICGVL